MFICRLTFLYLDVTNGRKKNKNCLGTIITKSLHLTSDVPEKFLIRFEDIEQRVIPYDGSPFIILSKYERYCMFGIDKNKIIKEREEEQRNNDLKVKANHLISLCNAHFHWLKFLLPGKVISASSYPKVYI